MATRMMGTSEESRTGAADWICLAAAPTFAIMALLTSIPGVGGGDMVCPTMQAVSPLNGMAWMYMLMAAFHSTPWLKLIAGRHGVARQP